jgi:hypothetical protein
MNNGNLSAIRPEVTREILKPESAVLPLRIAVNGRIDSIAILFVPALGLACSSPGAGNP